MKSNCHKNPNKYFKFYPKLLPSNVWIFFLVILSNELALLELYKNPNYNMFGNDNVFVEIVFWRDILNMNIHFMWHFLFEK
jgi:hypothetical protein